MSLVTNQTLLKCWLQMSAHKQFAKVKACFYIGSVWSCCQISRWRKRRPSWQSCSSWRRRRRLWSRSWRRWRSRGLLLARTWPSAESTLSSWTQRSCSKCPPTGSGLCRLQCSTLHRVEQSRKNILYYTLIHEQQLTAWSLFAVLCKKIPEGVQRVQTAAAGAGWRAEECGQPDALLPDSTGSSKKDQRFQCHVSYLVHTHCRET